MTNKNKIDITLIGDLKLKELMGIEPEPMTDEELENLIKSRY